VVLRLAPEQLGRQAPSAEPREIDPRCVPKLGRLPWAVLLKRVFLLEVLVCPKCFGRMKIIAVVTASASARRILAHLDLPTEAPRLCSARPPPQTELGDGDGVDGDKFQPDPPCPDW